LALSSFGCGGAREHVNSSISHTGFLSILQCGDGIGIDSSKGLVSSGNNEGVSLVDKTFEYFFRVGLGYVNTKLGVDQEDRDKENYNLFEHKENIFINDGNLSYIKKQFILD
jgi:hypothetical protein